MFDREQYEKAKLEYEQALQYFDNIDTKTSPGEIDSAIFNLNSAISNLGIVIKKTKIDDNLEK
jgi:hypothetical protein